MSNEFPKGLFAKKPREGAPDFVKGAISIKRVEFLDWLADKQDEWVNLDIKEGKSGKWYASVNQYKKSTENPSQGHTGANTDVSVDDINSIPF